jgi:ABC-2 type transport system permease protein
VNARYRLGPALRMEWLKLRSLRSTLWLLLAAAAAALGTGVTALAVYRTHLPRPGAAQMVNDGLAGVALSQLLVGFLGVLTVTAEYSSGSAGPTFAAVPVRGVVLAAKAAVFGGVTLVAGEAVCLVTFLASQAALSGSPVPRASLADAGVLRTVLLSGAYLALIGLIGLGVGAALRHTGAAVGALFAGLFVPLFVLGLFGPSSVPVARFVPMFILINSVSVVAPAGGSLSAWAGTGVLCGYAAAALALGGWLLTRRDV